MPRRTIDPIIGMLGFFESEPLVGLDRALSLAKEVVRRRKAGETVLTTDGPRIDPPQPKRKANRAPKAKRLVEEVVMP